MKAFRSFLRIASLLVGSACVAGLLAEFVVADLVGYPAHREARIFKVHDQLGVFNTLYWESPHAAVWIVEGGPRVYHFNNVGLPGCDLHVSPDARYLYIVGSSWVEAVEVPPDNAATSVLQRSLDSAHVAAQVVNLGLAGNDPYTSWFRVRFYEPRFPPSRVVLVLESFYSAWLAHHQLPLDFTLPPFFGREERRTGIRDVVSELRGRSAFVNLLEKGLRGIHVDSPADGPPVKAGDVPNEGETSFPDALGQCLVAYQGRYGGKFLVVSIIPDKDREAILARFCRDHHIAFQASTDILRSENRFNGLGHLDRRGNYEFGQFLYRSLWQGLQGE
jgi:hypothetical protein